VIRQARNVWKFLTRLVRRRSDGSEAASNAIPDDQPDQNLNPLDRIKGYLLDHGLSRKVRVRFDNESDNYILEDDDGRVYAKDYDKAVVSIQRTWL